MLSSSAQDLQPIAPAMPTGALPPSTQHPSLPSSSSSPSGDSTPIPSGSAHTSQKKAVPKRKRTTDGGSDSADGSSAPRTRDGPKKKKANRACFHCQKAHLTCDDSQRSAVSSVAGAPPFSRPRRDHSRGNRSFSARSTENPRLKFERTLVATGLYTRAGHPHDHCLTRILIITFVARPCQRCIKRGMADNCTEGHRKKAKYLLDEEELEALKRTKSGDGSSKTAEPSTQPQHPPPPPPEQPVQPPQYISPDTMYPTYQTPAPYGIPAEAANLEYSILSAILGGSPDSGSSGSPATGPAPQPVASTSYVPPQPSTLSNTTTWPSEPLSGQYASGQPTGAPAYTGAAAPAYAQVQGAQSTSAAYAASSSAQSPTTSSFMSRARRNPSSPTAARLVPNWAGSPMSVATPVEGAVQSVYKSVTKGYDYTQGYHFLMKHMSRRFDKNDILRIVRALAIVRPSFIALQMPMSEEDEVFVEKCFQRSLIELDKLVSFSGTPTVAWRRTGEICLVGPEFCMLTGWEREELVGRRKYIYELFENQSVVEYWENFANHAFENTTQSVYSHCVLLKPSGAPVPCTFCFSIRRDIMDLPSLVIGQWLPLL
ncbi:hypothetical protein C2E23DRAFT_18153 [Lenzites betulinus]|nr:hypothetical protein C2E23DRAFT_18153 [Lenzites betulinus]